jgi:transposase
MQGKKDYQEKLFVSFRLSDRVPPTNFYRRLKEVLDLDFLYELTRPYYGESGQKSIDPVVFFKLCLVGYLENIVSDRDLLRRCGMRMDILYFLGYDIDEDLPWHSTISRTRDLYGESVFERVFTTLLQRCVEVGMVSGHTQVVDSAPVKANASMDSLELKTPVQDLPSHLVQVKQENDVAEKEDVVDSYQPEESSGASNVEFQLIKPCPSQKATTKNNTSKKIKVNNKTHYSPTDPDARISSKPGKATRLNYNANIAVDTADHIITDVQAYHADKKDSQNLQDCVTRTQDRLNGLGLFWQDLLADANYSSGENYAFLEQGTLRSFIPPHGCYKGGHKDFVYDPEHDHWICTQGKIVPLDRVFYRDGLKKKLYRLSKKQCRGCPLMDSCLTNGIQKSITVTFYRAEYERNIARINNRGAAKIKAIRQSTVEAVLGTLKEQMGLRKINTIGIAKANKGMHMAATAYNVKKYLKFINKTPISMAGVVNQAKKRLQSAFLALKWLLWDQISCFRLGYEPLTCNVQ